MSDESSDCSDMNFRPSGSRGRQQNRQDQKRKRRIVMRIEFDDSDDSSSASDRTSDDEDDDVKVKHNKGNDLDDDGPSSSVKLRSRQKNQTLSNDVNNDNDEDSDELQRNAATRRLRRGGRRINVLDVGFSDGSSSGSEITRRKNSRGKKYIVSEDEREPKSQSANCKIKGAGEENQQQQQDEQGFTSDSSSNDLLEKCPICLFTFRQQEIGSPSTCEHIFCANCIEAWSKNVQTCPIDRIEFQRIIVRESYENRKIVREINVDPNAKKELVLEEEIIELDEDVTNCEICNSPDREDVMLLCDHCNQGYHMDCLSPPLSAVPEGSWYCDNCVDSEDEIDDEEEDLNMLYEDIRDMGIPESRLRVREVQQPRILRTRQNERIRAAILRRTRASIASLDTTATTITTNTSTGQRGRPRTTTTTTTRRSTANTNRSVSGSAVRKTRKRRRRRARQRTYVVEYDLNNFDEKFAIKTTKKVIKRRRRRRARTASKRGKKSVDGVRMTASKRLAEQMGVKPDPKFTSHLSGSSAGLSLFGGANDLEYFSDSDNDGNIESEIHIETGHGTAVQTSVRISNYGSQRSRKGLLLGRLQPNRRIQEPVVEQNNSNPDILSSIMDMQDRWHSAARNLESVHINTDGTLNLPNSNTTSSPAKENKSAGKESANGPSSSDINQAPMYSRGGGNANFNRGGGGGGGGYNNRSNNQNNYRGGGGGSGNQYRHSTGDVGSSGGFSGSNSNSSGGMNYNMVGRGNFNFSNNPNYNGNSTQPNNASPFQQRNFNQRNQQNQQQNQNNQRNNPNNNNQQRNSLPFTNNNDNMHQTQQHQQHQNQNQNNPFGGGMPQTFLPPPSHLHLNQQQQQNSQHNENSLFGGLPPPMSIPPPHCLNVAPPVLLTVPPPPAPPPVVIPPPVNSSLFQLNSDYGNNDDDSNCPNFAIYSHESQQVAKSSVTYPVTTVGGSANTANAAKEDDENEDLVQLDDDDEIPMPPDPNPSENVSFAELYEPENPTEENDDDDNEENVNELKENHTIAATKDDGDDYGDDSNDDEGDDNKKNKDKNKQQENQSNPERHNPEDDILSESSKNDEEITLIDITEECKDSNNDNDKQSDTVRSPSPAISDIRLPESETAAASRKGVLELYDDSDWEELDIDRPKDNDNKSSDKINEKSKVADEENDNVQEQDRSYTPCLDENNDPEEPEIVGGTTTPLITENSEAVEVLANKVQKSSKKDNKSANKIENMETELISDEEDELDRSNKDRKKNQKGGDKRGDRRDNDKVETFKKIGSKQKGRNYRTDKQPTTHSKRIDKRRQSSRSLSRSRSANSFRSRGGRSRSRSPRFRVRGNRSRSRSRSNNKENQGRWGGNFRDGGRYQRNNQQNRLKRRELQRYDVRNVIGHRSPSKNIAKDRYGRDTSRNRRNSRSLSRGRRGPPPRSPFSRSRSRNRRLSISLSPSPSYNRRRSLTPSRPTRQFSPVRRRSQSGGRRTPPFRQRSRSPLRVMRSRSISPGADQRMNNRKVSRHLRGVSPARNLRTRSVSLSPRYTPRLSRSRSKSPRPKGKKKKSKDARKKKSKRRNATMSPSPNRRITRQPDPFDIEKPPKKKRYRTPHPKSPTREEPDWSPSPSPPPQTMVENYDYQMDQNVSWTPPMQSPLLGLFRSSNVRSVSRSSRKEKSKRAKKKKKNEKRRDGRKEKKRKRRTETPEPAPSKEVFASGNNILVSVSFNKETTASQQQHSQQTIVTLPPNREDLLSNRRPSVDRVISSTATTKKRKEKRKKIDIKPVAIIDLERSPFQVEQEPTDVIVLTDSEEATEHRRDRRHSESCPRDVDTETHRNHSGGQRGEKSPERLDTIHEDSYDLTQTGGPKTPPEPPIVKFNLQVKKQNKTRNPLHEEDDDLASDAELDERQQQQDNHRSDMDSMHVQSSQKIGPNTPPESGPCSPDAYDPFEPTKSPSISPRSPTPPPQPLDASQNTICGENGGGELGSNQKHLSVVDSEQRREQIPGLGGNVAQGAPINPVDLVMALINSKSAANIVQDLANKSNEINSMGGVNSHDDSFRDKGDEGKAITVLSNLLISSSNMQHIPSISSPTPPTMSKKIPKIGGSVGGSSSSGVNVRNGGGTSNNADDSFNMNDIESPYSPGSADYEDLFEPPPDTSGNKRRSKRSGATAGGGSGKPEVFDNLFGSSSPAGNVRLPSYTPSKKHKSAAMRKSKVKVGKSNDDNIKIYDDVPNSAVELHAKDKFMRKLNRQERVVEEVKLVLKPRFNKKQITKDDYKEIMRRAVPKICHSKSGEIDPFKIKKLIEAYVKKFRAKHKKLNIVNTGQVSSAVKCAAYLKKL